MIDTMYVYIGDVIGLIIDPHEYTLWDIAHALDMTIMLVAQRDRLAYSDSICGEEYLYILASRIGEGDIRWKTLDNWVPCNLIEMKRVGARYPS
jgi:hypothetical protein